MKNRRLSEKMDNLEREWDTLRRSRSSPRIKRSKLKGGSRRSGGGVSEQQYSSIISSLLLDDQLILENSPGSLMSSLQEKTPGSEGSVWKVRTNDIAVEELLKERTADRISHGKLKGRRLFEGYSSEDGNHDQDQDYLCHQESEVRSLRSYGSDDERDSFLINSSCSLSEEEIKTEENLGFTTEGEEEDCVEETRSLNLGGENGGRWRINNFMAWFVLFAMAITIIWCSGGFLREEEVFLIPT